MYYICEKIDDKFGIKDTKDCVVEYYLYKDIVKFVKKYNLEIKGVSILDDKINIKVVDVKHYIWKYYFKSDDDYLSFLDLWRHMENNGDACLIPSISNGTISELSIHALVNKDKGYYEQWSVCDNVEYKHDVFTDIQVFDNDYNGDHPICDYFYNNGVWISNNFENIHTYYND